MPVMLGGSPEQCERLLAQFLTRTGVPLAAFGFSEPSGKRNRVKREEHLD